MNNALIWVFNTERFNQDRSGIYGYTQRSFAYNSNHIEGSTLTQEQTASLFEEGFVPPSDDVYRAKDIEEMSGHFLMFNYALSTVGQPLTEEIIKGLHYELKSGVFEDRANGYAIGDYKTRPNTVGGLKLPLPSEIPSLVQELLWWYAGQEEVTLETLAEFHSRFEFIHPFQDGNGRVGRILLFKMCLDNDIPPFIIHSDNRSRYVVTLRQAQSESAMM